MFVCVYNVSESVPVPGDPVNERCPQCPVFTSSGPLLPVASLMDLIHLRSGLPLSYCLLFSPAFLYFPETSVLSLCARSRTAAVWSFFPIVMFQA